MLKPKFLFGVFALLLSFSVFAQGKKISGKVFSSEKNPLTGVTVQVKDATIYTTTSEDGGFSVTIPGERAVLVFSSVGFETKEVTVTA